MRFEDLIVKRMGLSAGDRIVAPKSEFEIVQHHAIYLGQDHYGRHLICENAAGIGVSLKRLETFLKEYPKLTFIKKFTGGFYERKGVIERALSKLGKPYNLINYNCEHFANDVIERKTISTQVTNAFGLLVLALTVRYFVKN